MSYTEIFGFEKNGNAYKEADIKNSWRGAVAIWKSLEQKYLPPFVPEYAKAIGINTPDECEIRFGYKPYRVTLMSDENAMKEIWDLYTNKTVSKTDRICLGTTFDGALVKREDLPKVIKAFREFEGNTSLKEQADVLEEMLSSDNCIAVGWNQTSVNGDTWENYGGYDEEKDECIPYNCLTMDKHWYLFDEERGDLQCD